MHTNNTNFTHKGSSLYEKLSEQYKDKSLPNEMLKIQPVINAYHYHGFYKVRGDAEVSKLINYEKYQLKTIVDFINIKD
jgi:hypothetical protein